MDRYGVPQGEPGKGAQRAKVGLTVGGAGAVAAGAIAGTLVGGPIGTVVGAIGGLLGTVLTTAGSMIDPARAAARTSLMQQGLSRAYSDEYAKSQHLSDDQLVARAGQLHDKAAKGNRSALEGLAAIRTLRAERGALLAEQQAAMIATQARSGAVPLWAPAAFLAIVALGVVLTMRRRRR